ncbi:MAG: D-alanyl-D-alanine carboxypeptidase/D-alanyl-D-alanine-endopeptidase [Burkholderiaceae bacterium]
MLLLNKSLSLLAAALLLSGCAQLPSAGPSSALPAPVHEALQRAGLADDTLALVAFPLAPRGQQQQQARTLRLRADQALQPASTMKLLTSIVALDRLGPNARGRTDLLSDGAISGELLAGPLYLRGGADEALDWGALYGLLRQLRDQGVREIRGGLVVDRTLFRPARFDVGQPPFDEQPEFQYNVIPDALALNSNLLDYQLNADGQRLAARVSPAWPGIEIDASAVSLDDKACGAWEDGWKTPVVETVGAGQRVRLQGSFPRNCRQSVALNLVDRQWLAAAAVRQIWRELGGTLAAGDREGPTPAGARVLASHQGRPLAELMRGMMKSSDNPLTRMTYLRVGAAAAAPGENTLAAAERSVRAWFAEQQIDATGLVLENGSGLSRLERITPNQLAALLAASAAGRHGPELLGTLPVVGVDGTMRRRLKGTPVEGRARMKTGTLNNAVAVAGYVQDSHDQPWVLVGMINAEKAGRGRPALDALIAWVAAQ